MKTLRMLVASLLLCGSAWAASPSSINNDDSCDVSVSPAATLLLPYFEVDASGTTGQTTIFTVTNVTRSPQIAHVTLWTDYGYPVLTFNLYLTGYDVQAINLADVLVRGVVAPPSGTTSSTRPGQFSLATNPNLGASLDCAHNPGLLPQGLVIAIRTALTTGSFSLSSCEGIGATHANAIGYATVDVVATCTDRTPSDPLYYTNDLLFDNVLIGDYQQIGPHPAGELASTFDAGGNPMVHIRAVPEGGGAGSNVDTALPYTFYDRYTPAARRTFDRRQPLPSTFASRFIQGGPAGFQTNLTIWRESAGSGSCTDATFSAGLPVLDTIRFDEHENPSTFGMMAQCTCSVPAVYLPPTSSTSSSGSTYPPTFGVDVGGWFYLNLNNGGSTTRPSQNWVTVTMFGNIGTNHLTAEFDAAWLGNGCSPAAFITTLSTPAGPAGGIFVCPPGTTMTNGTTLQCRGTNTNPKP